MMHPAHPVPGDNVSSLADRAVRSIRDGLAASGWIRGAGDPGLRCRVETDGISYDVHLELDALLHPHLVRALTVRTLDALHRLGCTVGSVHVRVSSIV